MSFENIVGNNPIKEMLNDIIHKSSVSHSYLFYGRAGIGKSIFAKEFAKQILCLNQKIDLCESCVKFDSSNHPDFFYIDSKDNYIKVDILREIQTKMYEKPILSNKKVFIINDADKMTREAQNSLLKTLEEPNSFVVLLLIVEDLNKMLHTILSRCNKIAFQPIEKDELVKFLERVYNIQITESTLLDFIDGSVSKALFVNENKEIYMEISRFMDEIERQDIIEIFKWSHFFTDHKDDIFLIIEYMNVVFLNKLKQNFDHLEYIKAIHILEDTKAHLSRLVNFDMSMDNMLLELWEVFNG